MDSGQSKGQFLAIDAEHQRRQAALVRHAVQNRHLNFAQDRRLAPQAEHPLPGQFDSEGLLKSFTKTVDQRLIFVHGFPSGAASGIADGSVGQRHRLGQFDIQGRNCRQQQRVGQPTLFDPIHQRGDFPPTSSG